MLERTLRVDHVKQYRQPRYKNEEGEWIEPDEESLNAKPELVDEGGAESDSSDSSAISIDPEDPMRDYLIAKRKEEKAKRRDKGKKKASKSKHKDETPEERAARKARKREKKEKKAKKAAKSEGVRAVEDLLKGLGNPDMGRRPGRSESPVGRSHRDRSRSPLPSEHHRRRRSPSPYENKRRTRYSDDEDDRSRASRPQPYSGRGRDYD